MWTCPKCKAEVEQDFDVCWACGTSRDGVEDPEFDPEFEGIMDAENYEAALEARRHETLVAIAAFVSPAEAHMIRSRLEAEGIHAYLTGEQTNTWIWPIAASGSRVEVAEHDVERAREVLADVPHHGAAGTSEEQEEDPD